MGYIGWIAGILASKGREYATKNIEKKLRDGGAVSPETAITLDVAKITSRRELWWLNSLAKQGRVC